MARPKVDIQRREQILKAFESCLIKHGAAKVTLQKVADEAKLPRSLVRYFVGNRDKMVSLLIQRMINKAESQLAELKQNTHITTLSQLIDFIFDVVFFDDTTNQAAGRLWDLAQDDPIVTQALVDMYRHMQLVLINQMHEEDKGKNHEEREAAAFAVMALAYGDSSFRALGLAPPRLEQIKLSAHLLLTHL